MITFKQSSIFEHESEYGPVTIEMRLSDRHLGLYVDSGVSTYVDTSAYDLFSGDYECNGNAISGFTRASEASVLWTAHGLANGTPVYFENVGDPVPDYDDSFDGHNYIVSDANENDFKVVSGTIETDIFKLDKISRKVQKKVGGLIQSELKLDFDERDVDSVEDLNAIQFVERVSPDFKIFAAVFMDPSAPPVQGESLFAGVIQTNTEDNTISHDCSNFATDTNPIRSWKVTAKPTYRDLFDAISMDILINGDEDLELDAIDEAWETENVVDRPGWFLRGKTVKVHQLVSLNKLLRKLADQLEVALTAKDYGDYNIKFDRCVLDGKYIPARWSHIVVKSHYPRYVYAGGEYGVDTRYTLHADDAQALAIDPDGNGQSFVGTGLDDATFSGTLTAKTNTSYVVQIDALGAADTFRWSDDGGDTWNEVNVVVTGSAQTLSNGISVTFAAVSGHTILDKWTLNSISPYEEIWIDYKLIKENSREPNQKSATEIRWDKIKSFSELMSGLAYNFGIVLEEYYSDETTINQKFISRANFKGAQIYIRNVFKESRKISAILEESKNINANSSYYTNEGLDYYFQYKDSYTASNNIEQDKNKKLLLTIGTPMCVIAPGGSDDNWTFRYPELPANIYFVTNAGAGQYDRWKNSIIQTSSIYMYVDKRDGATDENDSYWTNAAQLCLNINSEEKSYGRMSDYINYLEGRDKTYAKIEKNIEVDYWNAFSASSGGTDPSLYNVNIGSAIVNNTIEYAVLSVDISLKKPDVKLKCEASAKYDILNPVTPKIVQPEGGIINSTVPEGDEICTASGEILSLDAVAIKSDGSVEKYQPIESHKGRFYGFALISADDGEDVYIRQYGELYNDDETWNFTPGKNVYARNLVTVSGNLSQELLTEKSASEDVIAIVAVATKANKIEFDFRNQPRQYLLQ